MLSYHEVWIINNIALLNLNFNVYGQVKTQEKQMDVNSCEGHPYTEILLINTKNVEEIKMHIFRKKIHKH